VAILRDHPITGTPGNTVADGFDVVSGTPVYATGGIGGGQCFAVDNDVLEYVEDNTTTAEYVAFYLRFAALPDADNTIATALVTTTHSAAMRVHSGGTVSIYSALGTLQDTSTTVLSAATWYRIEWRVGTATQEARLYTETGSTALETLTGVTAVATVPNKYRFGHPQSVNFNGAHEMDRVILADDWPNLGAVTGTGAAASAAGIAAGLGGVSLTGSGQAVAPSAGTAGAGTLTIAATAAATPPAATASGTASLTVTGTGQAVAPAGVASGSTPPAPYTPAGKPVAATIARTSTATTIPHTSTAVTEDE